jgi:DNA-binding XRE family transcriptional regulator
MTEPFNLRASYTNRGFSRRSFADELGVHEHSLRRLEKGLSVHPATAKKVADYFGMQATDLLPQAA